MPSTWAFRLVVVCRLFGVVSFFCLWHPDLTFIMSCLTNNNRKARKERISFWFGLGPSENIARIKHEITQCFRCTKTMCYYCSTLCTQYIFAPHRGLWALFHCGPEGSQPSSSISECAWSAVRCPPCEWRCRWSLCWWIPLPGMCTGSAGPWKDTGCLKTPIVYTHIAS